MTWEQGNGRCPGCGHCSFIRGGRIPDFIGTDSQAAAEIFGWPDDLVGRVSPWLLSLTSGGGVPPGASVEMGVRGLIDSNEVLTDLGSNLAYHSEEYRRLVEGDGATLLDLANWGTDARVLDVGCGAGQSLRLFAASRPVQYVGVDINAEALAFGCRLADVEGRSISLVRATAHALPFPGGWFSHVHCRDSLNYMHQRRALYEMARVLRPGGTLYCRTEGPGFDLMLLRKTPPGRRSLGLVRNLFLGCTHAMLGWQPTPGSRITGNRAFGTDRRCAAILRGADCDVIRRAVRSRYLGLPADTEFLAEKSKESYHH